MLKMIENETQHITQRVFYCFETLLSASVKKKNIKKTN